MMDAPIVFENMENMKTWKNMGTKHGDDKTKHGGQNMDKTKHGDRKL